MLLKTITHSKISDTLIEHIIEDPKGFKMLMDVTFFINIFMFIISILWIAYLFVTTPENILYYFPPCFLFVFYFKTLFSYREYFRIFIETFILQYDILKKIQNMSDDEVEYFFAGINKESKNKFLLQRKIL
jgi:hypothetical protein